MHSGRLIQKQSIRVRKIHGSSFILQHMTETIHVEIQESMLIKNFEVFVSTQAFRWGPIRSFLECPHFIFEPLMS